jgi:hypothetical protein
VKKVKKPLVHHLLSLNFGVLKHRNLYLEKTTGSLSISETPFKQQ